MEVGKFHIKVYTFGVKFYVFMHHCCMTKLAGEARLWNPRETKVQTTTKVQLGEQGSFIGVPYTKPTEACVTTHKAQKLKDTAQPASSSINCRLSLPSASVVNLLQASWLTSVLIAFLHSLQLSFT